MTRGLMSQESHTRTREAVVRYQKQQENGSKRVDGLQAYRVTKRVMFYTAFSSIRKVLGGLVAAPPACTHATVSQG